MTNFILYFLDIRRHWLCLDFITELSNAFRIQFYSLYSFKIFFLLDSDIIMLYLWAMLQ